MMQGVARRLTPARLVLDPIDALAWSRLAAGLPPAADTSASAAAIRERFAARVAAARPRPLGRISFRLIARLGDGGEVPFPSPVELLTVRNPAGYELFFDVVRTPAGLRRGFLPTARYRLRAEATLHQPVEVVVTLAGDEGATQATRIDLAPADGYPFAAGAAEPPTVLAGAVRGADGAPLPLPGGNAGLQRPRAVAVVGTADVSDACSLGRDGGFGIVVNPAGVAFGADGAANVSLHLRDAAGATFLAIPQVAVARQKTRAFTQTRLEGLVRWADGAPVPGARITAPPFPGEARSGADGAFAFHLPAQLMPGITVEPQLVASGPSGATASANLAPVSTRTIARVPTIVMQRP